MKKHDIESRANIELLVNRFYDKVKKDDTIGYIFNEILDEKWQEHLPIMYNFWASVLLMEASYKGNVMRKHIDLNKRQPLKNKHFEQWEALFVETVDELFEGDIAEEAKKRANMMSGLMQFKIKQSGQQNFIQ